MAAAAKTPAGPFEQIFEARAQLSQALVLSGANQEEDESVALLLPGVERWARSNLDPAAIEAQHEITPELRSQAAELGLYSLTVPEEHEGAGFSLVGAGRIIEALAEVDRSVAVSIGLHNGLGLRGLIAFASPALQARYLPRLASGELIAAFAATEPGAGSHIAGVRSIALPDAEDEGSLRLDGEKAYVTNGGFADVYTVLARTPGLGGARRGYSLLLVERNSEGLCVGREEDKLGIRASSTTPLNFESVRVPMDQVIGEPGKGLDLMNQILSWGRTLMSAGAVGGARAAYRMACTHALTRRQFGKPLAAFGQVKEKLARMDARIYAMESLVRMTGLLQARLGQDIVWISTAAKIACSEGSGEVADEAIQIHGGSGFIEEIGLARIYRDVRVTRIFEGANEVLRFHLAAGALPFTSQQPEAIADSLHPALQALGTRFDALHRLTRERLDGMAKRFGPRIMEHQLRLVGIADALVGLLCLEASLLRASTELEGAGEDRKTLLSQRLEFLAALYSREIEAGLARAEDENYEAVALQAAGSQLARFQETL